MHNIQAIVAKSTQTHNHQLSTKYIQFNQNETISKNQNNEERELKPSFPIKLRVDFLSKVGGEFLNLFNP